MEKRQLEDKLETVPDSIESDLAKAFRSTASPLDQKAVVTLILSIDDFWLKLKMLAVIEENKTILGLLNQKFINADVSIVSKKDEIGIPENLELLVDFIKEFKVKETIIPGSTRAREEQIKDSIFFLVHPKQFKAAICCYEGMQLLTDDIQGKLIESRMRKISKKSAGILLKFNHANEIKLGFDYAKEKSYAHFMRDLIRQTGELACSKFKADYKEKKGLEGWELAGWELINAFDISIQEFPEFEELVQSALIDRLYDAGVKSQEIEDYIKRYDFPDSTNFKKKYKLIRQLENGNKSQ